MAVMMWMAVNSKSTQEDYGHKYDNTVFFFFSLRAALLTEEEKD
jgi:hypothetical protein